MNETSGSSSLLKIQLTLLFEELNSSDALSRQYAISQLQNYLGEKNVVDALKKRLEVEDNFSCRSDIEETLKIVDQTESEKDYFQDETLTAERIAQLWTSVEARQLSSLFKQLKKLTAEDQSKALCGIFPFVKSVYQLIPLLSLSRRVLLRDEVIVWLEKMLSSKSSLLLVRVVSLLTRIKPAILVKYLPALLTHESLQVRLFAIKALHLLAPSEAIRLLSELIYSSDSTNRRSAFSFLLLLPFSDTANIALRLIESGELPDSINQIFTYLIYNNPDFKFFRRLSISLLLHGKRIKTLQHFWETAARSLVVAELTQKTEEELKSLAIEDARKFIENNSSQRLEEAKKEQAAKPEASMNEKLKALSQKEELSEKDTEVLENLLDKLESKDDQITAIRIIIKLDSLSKRLLDWLEAKIDSEHQEIVCETQYALAKINKNRLLPHLPLLVYSEKSEVVDTAISLYKESFYDKFLQKIPGWMKDGNQQICQVAYKSLLQIEFLKARDLIINYFKGSANSDRIKFFGAILVLNPDALTIHKLVQISANQTNERKKQILAIAEKIQNELGTSESCDTKSILGDATVSAQWENVLGSIKKITYEKQELTLADLLKTRLFISIMIVTIIVALIIVATNFRVNSYSNQQKAYKPAEKTSFSFGIKESDKATATKKSEKPWDYAPPKLATPSKDLFEVMTVEEKQSQHSELIDEFGPSAEELPPDQERIRLEADY